MTLLVVVVVVVVVVVASAAFLASSLSARRRSRALFLSRAGGGGGGGSFNDLSRRWPLSRDSDPNVTSFRPFLAFVSADADGVTGNGGRLAAAARGASALALLTSDVGVASFLFLAMPPMLRERMSRTFCSRLSKLERVKSTIHLPGIMQGTKLGVEQKKLSLLGGHCSLVISKCEPSELIYVHSACVSPTSWLLPVPGKSFTQPLREIRRWQKRNVNFVKQQLPGLACCC